ncbi:MAG TPA: hypothetical protein P5081_17965 [Phycisphaerae bacterium]|nr:hypothetical protein [Phycisphaerae bacterium]HRW54759.1 hypothetical protein [Phycisphaerae bacterium]
MQDVHPGSATRRRRIVGGGVLICLWAVSLTAGCARAVWYVAPEFGEAKAKKDNLPILYYFKAWDSTQHRNMLRNVLHDSRVNQELRTTINIELEYGFFDEQADRFKVRKPQVCVLAAPDGSRLTPNYYVNPVPTPEAFLAWLKDAKAKAGGTATGPAPTPTAPDETPPAKKVEPTPMK